MKKVVKFKVGLVILSICFSSLYMTFHVLGNDVFSDTAGKNIEERRDEVGYQYRIHNGRMQRRLYNFSLNIPLSDWEYF